jgi:hypothetical protein
MMMTTTKPLIQIDDEIREMNDEEFAAHQERQAIQAEKEAAKIEKEAAKAALLERLGMTAEEAALLLS